MQNDPTQGNSNPNAVNHPAHVEAAKENNELVENNEELKDEPKSDEEAREEEPKKEDFEKFDVEKVDKLKKSKKEDIND